MNNPSPFKSVVFSGGGSRCFWQAGFWTEAAPALNIKPEIIAGASAGATIACAIFSGQKTFALNYMIKAAEVNEKNIYIKNMFNSRKVFPHEEIYRRAVLTVIDDDALKRLHEGPDIRIQLSRPPLWAGPRAGVLLGFSLYSIEKAFSHPIHPKLGIWAGFKPDVISVKECQTPNRLTDLLIAASCTPPMTSVQNWDGKTALDGGLVDNVPVNALGSSPGSTLILLTRRYPVEKIPVIPGRVYVQPSEDVPVKKWDYTDAEGLQKAYELGRKDGDEFVKLYRGVFM